MTTNDEVTRVPASGRKWRRAALTAVLLAGTALGGFAVGHPGFAEADSNQNATTQSQTQPVNPPQLAVQPHRIPDFVELVAQVKPAVVSVTTKLKSGSGAEGMQGFSQLPFPFNQMIPNQPRARAVEARGSGFIIDADGTIVTNNHVVNDAKSVSVTLDDGTELPAKIIGRDPRTDIAVLRVDADHKLPYIQLGNSRDVKPGEWVIAMGNPFGLGGTVTEGIVSAVSRNIGAGPYDQFIQVDAPINQGNSGGPLFTQDGKVIGMNTAILSPSGGSVGIGFAIPSNMIRTVVAQLEEHGHVTRGYIGVEVQALKGATAKALHLSEDSGALVAGVQPDSPASQAGIQPGDVVQSVNGTKISNPRDLAVNIAGIKPGGEAELKVLRNGEAKDIDLKVAQMPNEQVASNETGGPGHRERLGLALAPLSPGVRGQLDLPAGTKGAVISGVQPGSPAQMAGLQPGDVIVGVGTKPVDSPSEAVDAIRSAMDSKSHAVALRVVRNGEPIFVGINMEPQQNQG